VKDWLYDLKCAIAAGLAQWRYQRRYLRRYLRRGGNPNVWPTEF
jgi:hypothetical protein